MTDKWTRENIPDLTGKVLIVTGANSGIGFEATKEFSRKGARTILACRNLDKAEKAKDKILKEIPEAQTEIMHLDLANLDSIKQFANEFKEKYERLDVLLNNAGIMMVPYRKTKDGFESQIGINHLGHFALTCHLKELLISTENSRVVNVSSIAHKSGVMDFENLMYEKGGYNRSKAYSQSKLANLLFTFELDKRFKQASINSIALAAHPGVSNTHLADHMMGFLAPVLKFLFGFIMQSAEMGALPIIRAATDPNAEGSDYYGPDGPKEKKGYPVKVEAEEQAHNKEDAKKLWGISEDLTNCNFSLPK